MGFLGGAIINFLDLLQLLIIVDAIMSWFIRPRSNEISRIIGIIIDPILSPCYKLQSKVFPNLPIDFSPLIALFAIYFVKFAVAIIF